jgi:hypothetical protein
LLWPDGKRFAFSIFDDPDSQTLQGSIAIYEFLSDLGLRSTIGVWPIAADPALRSDAGMTCANLDYLNWILELQSRGFEIGFHNATSHTSLREQTESALQQFEKLFGAPPKVMSNHYHSREALYWGADRLSGLQRKLYNLGTRGKNQNISSGHRVGHPTFWGDLAKAKIRYCRNFVFGDINTLKQCPAMPYHDPDREFVNYWYASSEGANVRTCLSRISEQDQDRLEQQRGACILYVHFGHGFQENGQINPRFRNLMRRLVARQGWFAPVSTLLDHLLAQKKSSVIRPKERSAMERRWLLHKLRHGSE